MPVRAADLARLLAKVEPEPNSGCWIWVGSRFPYMGYGRVKDGGRERLAHRVSWELATQAPVPDGMAVLHRCDNPPCVNPDHLFLGTLTDNNVDRMHKGRSSTGSDHGRRIVEGLARSTARRVTS